MYHSVFMYLKATVINFCIPRLFFVANIKIFEENMSFLTLHPNLTVLK